jgi:signal transduction histidine kinase
MPKPAPEPKQEPKPKQEPTPQPKPKPAPESDQQPEQKPHKAHLPKLIPKGHTVPRPDPAEKQPFRLKFHLPWKGEETAPTDSELAARRKVSSLRTRWLLNSMGAVGLVVAVVTVLAIVLMGSYFYTTMGAGLENKAQTAAEFFSHYQTESEYRERASDYVANFGDTDSIELEFLDTQGEIVLSSYAYQQTAGIHPDTGDITTSLSAATISRWVGRDPTTGERIMAVSAPVVQDGSVKGVIRMVTSMSQVDHQVLLLSVLLLAVAAAILLMIYFTNLYFVRSIAEPIAAITETTKRIAAGSYGVQMEKKYNDEIGELVDTINDMSLKVSQAEKMKSEFISSVSHELRTPLTAINGWGETLLRGEVTDPRDVHKGMAIIVSEAKRLTKMVEELLEFSRIEDGRFTLRIEPIDIKAELEDAVYTYREFFRKKGITLEYNDCEEDFPPIPGDPERLRQVFSNLLDNAAKHGGSGKRITVSIFPEGSMVAIRIRDYGHGIPPEELPHVKTKFYKGSSKVRGSGIGLAVCDEIAIRHNGSLTIENAQGGGCAVTLRLPVHEKS